MVDIPREKMVELFANSGDTDQTSRCFPVPISGSPVFSGLILMHCPK